MKYHLSNRQQKEMLSGATLSIALPYPDSGIPGAYRHHSGLPGSYGGDIHSVGTIDPESLANWYRASLNLPEGCAISQIVIMDVPVSLDRRPGGLGEIFGHIYRMRQDKGEFAFRIVCVVANICMRNSSARNYPTQWPGSAEGIQK